MSRKSHELIVFPITSYERIISCVLFFCSAPQAALLKFDEVSRNHLMDMDKISDNDHAAEKNQTSRHEAEENAQKLTQYFDHRSE